MKNESGIIKLSDVIQFTNPKDYKLHCAGWNGFDEPLDVFVNDRLRWHGWNYYKPTNNDFNRRYIFSMMRFYPESNIWLFGGVYEVLSSKGPRYKIKLTDQYSGFMGRLKMHFIPPSRARRLKLEKHLSKFTVSEILKESYSGKTFSGYEDIELSFIELENIIKNKKPDWRGALENFKGVYLITDNKNGKKYVGSAYGKEGLWTRWSAYIETGHGGNKEFKALIKKRGIEYARKYFKFVLLEFRPAKVEDDEIIEREVFWKKALLTRGDFGYNRN